MAEQTVFIITTRPHYSTKYWGGNRGGWTYFKERAHHYQSFDAADAAVRRNSREWQRRFGYDVIKLKEILVPTRGIVAGKEPNQMADQPQPINQIQEARAHAAELENRMNRNHPGGIEERTLYEDRPFKRGMLAASIAQAEQLRRIADMIEGYLSVHADPAVLGAAHPINEGE